MEPYAYQEDYVAADYSRGQSGMRVKLLMGDCAFYYPHLCRHQKDRLDIENRMDDAVMSGNKEQLQEAEDDFNKLFDAEGWDIHGADMLGRLRSEAAHDKSKAATAVEARLTREKIAASVRAKREDVNPSTPVTAAKPAVVDYSIPELQQVQRDPKAKVVFTEKPKPVRKPKIPFPKAKSAKPAELPHAATTPAAPTNGYQPMNPKKLASVVQQIRSSSSDLRNDTSI